MRKITLTLSMLLVTCVARVHEISHEQKILDKIIEKDDQLTLGPEKDAILILGTVGSGSTTLTLLLTDAELEVKEIIDTDGGLLRIDDKYNQISNLAPTTPKTIVPNLIVDDINGTAYYDCPGFSESKEINVDIASTFTFRKLLNFLESMKFIFTVTYASMPPADNVHFDFGKLCKYASNLINNLEKYRDGIALVVTQVPNNLDDAMAIQSIVTSMANYKIVLEKFRQTTDSTQEKDSYTKQIQFVDILLEKDGDKFTKIGIFRTPNEKGSLNDNQSALRDKATILHIINDNLRFVRKAQNDFSFSLAASSKPEINDIIERILSEIINDFKSINAEVKAFILREEKHYSRNLSDSNAMATKIHGKLLQINSNEPQEFKRQFVDMIDDLAISISGGNLRQSLQYFEILNFLNLFTDKQFTVPTEISNELTNLKAYVKNSLDWYEFLTSLHDKLSTYDIQKRAHEIDGSQLMNTEIHAENIEQSVSELNIKSNIDLIDSKLYSKIEKLLVNSYKLELLHAVWGQSMQSVTSECLADGAHLLVKGYNVRLSNIVEMDCFKIARHVQIFALHKVFIDCDVNQSITNVTLDKAIISPQWDIVIDNVDTNPLEGIEKRDVMFNFDGHAGKNMDAARDSSKYPDIDTAREKLSYPERGEDGDPGHAGESGGQLLAIGRTVTGASQINVFVAGGRGGKGQSGGNGLDGKNGTEIPDSTDIDYLTSLGFKYLPGSESGPSYEIQEYHFQGTSGTRGTDGGHGGCGGPGGLQGKSFILGFENSAKFSVKGSDGEKGPNGEGGRGGKEAMDGRPSTVQIKSEGFVVKTGDNRQLVRFDAKKQPAGENGIDGKNCPPVTPEPFNAYNPAITFSNYKYYAREHLANHIQISNLNGFLTYLNDDSDLNEIYDTNGLINEFESIESDYFRLRDKISFVPVLKTLGMRIATYSRSLPADRFDERQAINYLYTALKSRQFAIETHENYVAVVDLLSFMKTIKERMERFHQTQRTQYIIDYRDTFKNDLDKKIAEASSLVDRSILPSINDTIQETDVRIKELLNELSTVKDSTEKQLKMAKENEETLRTKLMLHTIMSPLRLVSASLALFGPPGLVAGAVIGTGLAATETIIDSTLEMKTVSVPTALIQQEVARITNHVRSHYENLELQLNDLFDILKSEATDELKQIETDMNEVRVNVQAITKITEIPNPDQAKQLEKSREQLVKTIEATTTILLERNNTNPGNPIILKSMSALDRMKNILTVGQTGIEIYRQIRDDNIKLREASSVLSQVEQQMQLIRQHEMNILNVMIPELRMVEQSIKMVTKQAAGKSHVALDVSRWSIQNTLKDVKNLFNQMSKNFPVNRDLDRCIEKLMDGMTTIIDVYDRIDSYTEKAQLATLISDIAIAQKDIQDENLKRNITQMETIINGNLIMEKYEMAMIALKQHKFPFAERFLNEFDLPSNINATDATFIGTMIQRIDDLVLQITESRAIIEEIYAYFYNDYPFILSESFYTWDSANHKEDIINLLNGDEVLFNADIKDGLEKSAVKFSEIWIQFILKNDDEQKRFNEELLNFEVQMEMVGHSYYRCDNRIYYISLEKPILLAFTLDNGQPTKPNQIYSLLKTGDYFLSPYVTWKLSLSPKNDNNNEFRRLRPFVNQISKIILEGRGQFLRNKKNFLQTICNENLDRYYRLDSIANTA